MKRIIAMSLAVALCGSLFVTGAFAQETEQEPAAAEQAGALLIAEKEPPSEEGTAPAEPVGGTVADTENQADAEPAEELPDEPVILEPDAVGTLSWGNLEKRVRENNFTVLALEENIAAIQTVDFDKQKDQLLQSLNQIASQMFMMRHGSTDPISSIAASLTLPTLESTYASLESTFDDLASGKIQRTTDGTVRQLRNAEDQLVQGAQSLYMGIMEMKSTRAGLERQKAALERTVKEMELRYNMGQISALTLQQVKSGYTALVSGMATLDKNIADYTAQLQLMVGAEITGSMTLTEVPEVTDAQIAAMDPEKDLESARAASYELLSAKLTLDNAEEAWKDAKDAYKKGHKNGTYTKAMREAAEHTWQAAQYTYQSTLQSYDLRFRTMFGAVADCRSKLTAQNTALELQRATCKSVELKYQQGTVSLNTLLAARDDVASAEKDVLTAKHDLFTAYNTYCWARNSGLLN